MKLFWIFRPQKSKVREINFKEPAILGIVLQNIDGRIVHGVSKVMKRQLLVYGLGILDCLCCLLDFDSPWTLLLFNHPIPRKFNCWPSTVYQHILNRWTCWINLEQVIDLMNNADAAVQTFQLEGLMEDSRFVLQRCNCNFTMAHVVRDANWHATMAN